MSKADRERRERQELERIARAAAELERQRAEADAEPGDVASETTPAEEADAADPDPAEVWASVKAKLGAEPTGDGWASVEIGGATVGIGPTVPLAPEPYDPMHDAAAALAALAEQALGASDQSDEQRAALAEIPRALAALPAVLGEDLWYALRWIAEQETDPALRLRHRPSLTDLAALCLNGGGLIERVDFSDEYMRVARASLTAAGRLALATIDGAASADNARGLASGRSQNGARVRVTGGPFTGRRGTLIGHDEHDGEVKSYRVRLDVDVEICDGKASKIEPSIEVDLVPRWLIPISTGAAIVRVRGNDGPHPYVKRPYPPAVTYGDRSEAFRFETFESAGEWCDGATDLGALCYWIEPAPERVSAALAAKGGA